MPFSTAAAPSTFPPAAHKASNFSTFSPTLVIFCFFKMDFFLKDEELTGL